MKYRGTIALDFDAADDIRARKFFQDFLVSCVSPEVMTKTSQIKLQELTDSAPPRKVTF